jgi:hypothetical protein
LGRSSRQNNKKAFGGRFLMGGFNAFLRGFGWSINITVGNCEDSERLFLRGLMAQEKIDEMTGFMGFGK